MKLLFMMAALGLTLMAGPLFAQESEQQSESASGEQAADDQAQQAQPEPVARPTQPPRPFPEGAKIAYVDTQAVISQSSEGKAAQAKIKAFSDKMNAELEPRQKALQDSKQKLEQSGTVMSEEARAKLERDVERQRIELQRATQDAQREFADLQNELQQKFVQKLLPVVNKVAQEKGLHFVLTLTPEVLYADRGLDITSEVVKALDAGEGTNSPPKK